MLNWLIEAVAKLAPNSDFVRFLLAVREFKWKLNDGYQVIYLEYPVNPVARYGFGKPPHPQLQEFIGGHRRHIASLLEECRSFRKTLARIPGHQPQDAALPYWNNGFFAGLEAIALYSLPVLHQSKLYIEIGSGNSTKFVRQSINDNHLDTRIVSIDPHPRAEVDAICDQIIRCRLEDSNLDIFNQLEAGDILVFDGSHRCFQNSDVTVFFLEILPGLKPGVLVYVDDIYLPYDYPPLWYGRFFSEQYLLATLLLANPAQFTILLPCVFVKEDEELRRGADALINDIRKEGVGGYGSGIWMRVNGATEEIRD